MILLDDTVQQLIAQMALDKSRQMAEVTPVIFFDKLQKDNPGGVHSVLAQRIKNARIVRFLENQRREGSAKLVCSVCVLHLGGGNQLLQLRRSEACALGRIFLIYYVDYNLSVAVKVLRMTEFCAVLHQA